MADPAKHPCTVRDGRFVEPCTSLANAFDGTPMGSGRALFLMSMTNLRTLVPTRSFVVLRMGNHLKKGIALNCCPFCGERIDAPFSGSDGDNQGATDHG